jgi:cation diffusion facilitator CzcD-associated flavoprotein CzcO
MECRHAAEKRLARLAAHVCSAADRTNGCVEVAIVGAGFSGMLCAVSLLDRGVPLEDIMFFEAGDEPGGVWRKGGVGNYPGAACDVQAYEYLPLLQRVGYVPSRKYVGQNEIATYSNQLAKRFGLLPRIRFGTKVTGLRFVDGNSPLWEISATRASEQNVHRARHVIVACGPLSAPQLPHIDGLGSFRGPSFHTAAWDHSATVKGKRVGVVGTGASAAQVVTAICDEVEHLTVFQRSPVWCLPRNDQPTPDSIKDSFAQEGYQDKLRSSASNRIDAFATTLHDPVENAKLQNDVREIIARSLPNDEELQRRLTPEYPFWCKRVLFIDDYYSTFAKKNVSLVADAGGVVRETDRGLLVASGDEFELDVIIYATGFNPLTVEFPVAGRGGKMLREHWGQSLERPSTLFGIHTRGFPNLYFMCGPQAFNPVTNVTVLAEDQARYVADLVVHMRSRGLGVCEPTAAAETAWVARSEGTVAGKVWTRCSNWYMKTSINGEAFYGTWMSTHGHYLKSGIRHDNAPYRGLDFSGGASPE